MQALRLSRSPSDDRFRRGTYRNERASESGASTLLLRAKGRMKIILPVVLFVIFLLCRIDYGSNHREGRI
jgi:hypothetical protein